VSCWSASSGMTLAQAGGMISLIDSLMMVMRFQ
jgi:hypothetical protein